MLWIGVLLTGSISIDTGFYDPVIAASDLSIVAAGDWGCTENTRDTVSNIKNSSANLVLALGDYSYSYTPTCWLNIVKPIKSITRINIGNHDDQNIILLREYLNHFGLQNSITHTIFRTYIFSQCPRNCLSQRDLNSIILY